jgi:hypothetical protein
MLLTQPSLFKLLNIKPYFQSRKPRLQRLPRDTPLSVKGGTNFADKRWSLGRYIFARGLTPRTYSYKPYFL